jgi:uncharacterized membrane protein YciS (DUF1049 family)
MQILIITLIICVITIIIIRMPDNNYQYISIKYIMIMSDIKGTECSIKDQ